MPYFNTTDFILTTDGDGRRVISLVGGGGGSALPWYNVMDYGAVGDDATDDYAAFIACRDAIWAAGVPAVFYVPSGTYRLSNYVQLQSQADRPPMYVLGDWAVMRPTTDTSVFYRKWDNSGDFTEVVQLVIDGFFFLPTVSGSSTGVHTVDSWGTIVRRCHFKNLKIGYHVQAVNSWNEGWASHDNIIDNCTQGMDFNNAGGTGSFQSGRMTNTVIRTNAGQKGIRIWNGANLYGSHLEFNIWVGGNSAVGIEIDGNVHSCKFEGLMDNAGAGGTPLYGILFSTNASNTDRAEFSIDFAGTYTGTDPQTSNGAVHNAFSKTWYYDPKPYGSRLYPRFTLLTATGDTPYASAANTWARRAIGSAGDLYKVAGGVPTWAAPAALTKTDDTNVTATLGGSASTALVNAASITLGWTGTLAVSRGGIGVGTLASNGVLYGNGTGAVLALAVNATATNKYLRQVSSGAPSWETIPASEITSGAALTKTDDTNVTATLGGTPASALLVAASITLGWTGTLAQSRGGTGSATPFANPSASVGLSAVNGAATTFMRSDAAPALSQAITPTWTGLHKWNPANIRVVGTVTVGVDAAATAGYSFDVQDLRARFAPAFTTTTSLDAAVFVAPTITNNTTANIAQFHIGGSMVGNADSPIGFLLRPFFNPSSSITEAFGGSLAGIHNGGTISSDLVGFRAIVGSFVSTGALSGSVTGVRVDTPVYLGTVKPATAYGIRIQNQGVSGETSAIGLWIDAQANAANNFVFGFGTVDTTVGVGGIYGRIPIAYNGLLKYLRVYGD